MSKYNVLAVNSTGGGGERLESLAQGTDINLIPAGMNGESPADLFRNTSPDLVLIESNGNGEGSEFDLANELNQIRNVPVLFLTDKLKNGSNGSNGAENFLNYPVTKHDLSQTVTDAILNFRKKFKAGSGIKEAPLHRNAENHSFFIKIGNKLKRVETFKIEYIEVQEKYCSINIENRQIHVKIALKDFLEKLPEGKFIRVHRNYVINTDYVSSVNLSENMVLLSDDRRVPFSRTYKEQLMNQLNLI